MNIRSLCGSRPMPTYLFASVDHRVQAGSEMSRSRGADGEEGRGALRRRLFKGNDITRLWKARPRGTP